MLICSMSWDKTSSKKCVAKSWKLIITLKMRKPSVTKVQPRGVSMPKEIHDGFQSLHFDTLTLSLTRVNWVKRWSKAQVISLKGPTMWISSTKDGNTQLGAYALIFRKTQWWPKTNKRPFKGSPYLVFKDDLVMATPSTCYPCW
jgi:hypothetical protein